MHATKLLVAIVSLSAGLASAKDRVKRIHTLRNKNGGGKKDSNIMNDEDVIFLTRILQSMSAPSRPTPPRPRPTPKPIPFPTPPVPRPPSPSGPTFRCPATGVVGCTAVDPRNPEDECPIIGEPCVGGNRGGFCCLDACPRNYCTAKEAPR